MLWCNDHSIQNSLVFATTLVGRQPLPGAPVKHVLKQLHMQYTWSVTLHAFMQDHSRRILTYYKLKHRSRSLTANSTNIEEASCCASANSQYLI